MKKITGYKIKDSVFDSIVVDYEKHKDICTLQEYIVYYCGIPTGAFLEYFDKKGIDYDRKFEPDLHRFAEVNAEIISRNYEIVIRDVCLSVVKETLTLHSIGFWDEERQAYYSHEAGGYINTEMTDIFEFYYITYRKLKEYIKLGMDYEN